VNPLPVEFRTHDGDPKNPQYSRWRLHESSAIIGVLRPFVLELI